MVANDTFWAFSLGARLLKVEDAFVVGDVGAIWWLGVPKGRFKYVEQI